MAANFIELVRLRATDDPNVFISCSFPEKMGNPADIAYGGCVMALSVQAAFKTVEGRKGKPDFEIYSLLGNYLGPTLADRNVKLRVSTLRDTRSFATRFVIASQTQNDGSERDTFSASVDFIAPNTIDTASVGAPYTRYSKKPRHKYAAPETLPTMWDILKQKVQQGAIAQEAADVLENKIFALNKKVLIGAQPPESLHTDNGIGVDATVTSKHHANPLPERYAADWFKSRVALGTLSPPPSSDPKALPVTSASANASLTAFVMDGALSFIPLTFSQKFLSDAGSVSSLDCALRFHSVLNLDDFHLREMYTLAGNDCRTYSEALLWDRDENLVATMNQSCILRPKVDRARL
ncbi:hypothetical protein BCV70DRAFT_81590 [Testicularia cyperi]|uniref:Thioesterase/thiol ester dehydrase-isomerase n=1 Tax=Testicularia cyperi TaxID=1882483 RepID=A0A317XFY0_9BASI|nr:hypothetical protein BCV70DRAFT_81590 [Testicularia cyperi]